MLERTKVKPLANPQPAKGTAQKPDFCHSYCPRATIGAGFVPDWVPENPKLAVMVASPDKDSVVERMPFSGGYGGFFWAAVAKELGIRKQEILISHVIRCYSREYPIGEDRKRSEQACRNWDRYSGNRHGVPVEEKSLVTWDPNIFLCTFSLDDMVTMGAYMSLALNDFEKALRFAEGGYRPLVLMGGEAIMTVAPWLQGKGGEKTWRGHWWEGKWKWTTQQQCEPSKNLGFFIPAKDLGYSKKRFGKKLAKPEKPAAEQKTMFE